MPDSTTAAWRPWLPLLWGVLAYIGWVFIGAFEIDVMHAVGVRPLWWVASSGIAVAVIVTYIARFTRDDPRLSRRLIVAVPVGGAVAVALATPLNRAMPDALSNAMVGPIEEGAKLAVALIVAIGIAKTARSGMLIGTAVGLGFTVWENAGYAYSQFETEATFSDALVDLGVRWLGLGVHALFAGAAACAVFAAIERASAARIATAVLVVAAVAAAHSGFDALAEAQIELPVIGDVALLVETAMTVLFIALFAWGARRFRPGATSHRAERES
jgi:RsiW-degrading membrane proteinase PrsW (M82 family)